MQLDITFILLALVAIVVSMVIHEMTHAYVSYWLGDDTAKLHNRLSINPIRHLDPVMSILLPLTLAVVGGPIFGGAKPVPYNPANIKWGDWGAALVALSGPFSNLLLAFVGYATVVLIAPKSSDIIGTFLPLFISVNLGFFIFNLLPVPPLDGSRVLYALAPEYVKRFMESIEKYGIFILFGLIIFAQSWLYALMINSQQLILEFFKFILMIN